VSEAPTLKQAIPILRIFSVEKAKEFYLDFLGVILDWPGGSRCSCFPAATDSV
jgi:hypothetical protein